jgi:hypothetical protein
LNWVRVHRQADRGSGRWSAFWGGKDVSTIELFCCRSCRALGATALTAQPAFAQAQPNIVFIMGDDIGWSNIGVYNQGIMSGRTPNLDKLASEGC